MDGNFVSQLDIDALFASFSDQQPQSPSFEPPPPRQVSASDCVKYYKQQKKTKTYYLVFPTMTTCTPLARPRLHVALYNWPCDVQPWVGDSMLVFLSQTPEGYTYRVKENLVIPPPKTSIWGNRNLAFSTTLTVFDGDIEFGTLFLQVVRQNSKRKAISELEPTEKQRTKAAIPRPVVDNAELTLPSAAPATYMTPLPLPTQAAYAVMMGMLEAVASVLNLLPGIDAMAFHTSREHIESTYQALGAHSLTLRHFNIGNYLIQSLAWNADDKGQSNRAEDLLWELILRHFARQSHFTRSLEAYLDTLLGYCIQNGMVCPEFFVYIARKLRQCLRNQVPRPPMHGDEDAVLEYVLDTASVPSIIVDKLEYELNVYEQ